MPKKKTSAPKRKGPKLMGTAKRERRALTFDPFFLKQAEARASKEGKSLSLWLENLGRAALKK